MFGLVDLLAPGRLYSDFPMGICPMTAASGYRTKEIGFKIQLFNMCN